MAYQQNLNQLLTVAGYFAQPYGEKRRENKAREDAIKTVGQKAKTLTIGSFNNGANDYQAALDAAQYETNIAQERFDTDPTMETLSKLSQARQYQIDLESAKDTEWITKAKKHALTYFRTPGIRASLEKRWNTNNG